MTAAWPVSRPHGISGGFGRKAAWHANSATWPVLCLVLLLGLQATMIFTRAINWDEFFYYMEVEAFARGELARPLQTFHVRLFAWLPALEGNGVQHIVAARIAMFACELVTLFCIAGLARRFTDAAGALLAALCYLSAGYVLQHGFSFRVDPLATAALMGALTFLALGRLGPGTIAGFGLCAALAGMITIKAVLFAPAFAGIGWLRWSEHRLSGDAALRLAGCIVAALGFFALAYWWHAQGVSAPEPGAALQRANQASQSVLSTSQGSLFFLGVPPYWQMMIKAASLALPFTGLIALVPYAIARDGRPAAVRIALAGVWLPILTLLFYRNTAPYYYAFVLAPVAVGCTAAVTLARKRVSVAALALVLTGLAVLVFAKEDRTTLQRQSALVSTVDGLFAGEDPVNYFDHNGMLGSFPKANGFMTPWGQEQYYASGQPAFLRAMETRVVPLLLENDPLLSEALIDPGQEVLLAEDAAALRENFLRYWGPVWVAGVALPSGDFAQARRFLVPGRYRIEGGAIIIDEALYRPGEIASITRGKHRVESSGVGAKRLIWADVRPRPVVPPSDGPLWVGF